MCEVGKVRGIRVPGTPGYQPDDLGSPQTTAESEKMTRTGAASKYRQDVASCIWGLRTRPDIRHTTTCLCKFMSNPGERHCQDLKKVMRYVAKYPDWGLKLAPKDNYDVASQSDSDWAANKTTRKSISGAIHTVGGSLVLAEAKTQPLTALSTFEAELIALMECAKSNIYVRAFLGDMGYPQLEPSKIGVDNQSVLAVSESIMIAWKNRHIPLRYFKIRQLVIDREIELHYVQSDENVADAMTKALGPEPFEKHRASMMSQLPPMDHAAEIPMFS